MLTIILTIVSLAVGWACGEWSGYKRCVKDYKDLSEKVEKKDLPMFINS